MLPVAGVSLLVQDRRTERAGCTTRRFAPSGKPALPGQSGARSGTGKCTHSL